MINSNLWFGRRYASVGGNPAKIRSLSHCLQGDGTVTYPRWYRTSSNVMSCSLVLWKVESWLKTNKWLTCSSCCLDLFLKKISVLSIPIISCFYLIPPGNLNGDQNPNDSTWRTSARGNFISFWEQTWNGLETVKVGTVYLQSQMFHPLDTSPRLFLCIWLLSTWWKQSTSSWSWPLQGSCEISRYSIYMFNTEANASRNLGIPWRFTPATSNTSKLPKTWPWTAICCNVLKRIKPTTNQRNMKSSYRSHCITTPNNVLLRNPSIPRKWVIEWSLI